MAYLFAAFAGVLNMVQAGCNSTLNKALGVGPIVPALIVYAGGVTGIAIASMFLGQPLGNVVSNAAAVPWWAWIGGLIASVYVIATLTTAKTLGAASFIAVTLTSAVVTSLVLDHFGWLGFDVRPATAGGMAGGALMIVGVVMIATF